MATKYETLTLSTIPALFNLESAYVLAYSWAFGMSLWVSFFGGVIAYRALPRTQFGTLQHATFPVYFSSSIALSSALLALWVRNHPGVLSHWAHPFMVDVFQAYILATVTVFQASNYFIIGPLTSKLMFKRQRQEKEEGKAYNHSDASAEMKSLNAQFGALHGISSLANLGAIIALGFHGLWIANAGPNK